MADIFVTALDAIYDSEIGRDASFAAFSGGARIIDKTGGVEVKPLGNGASVNTIVPAIMVRMAELTARGVTSMAALVGTNVTFNGGTWSIINHRSSPQPGGERAGEVRLFLRFVSAA